MVTRVGDKLVCAALIVGLVAVLPGCSFLFTTAPKSAPSPAESTSEYESSKCTTSKAAPVVDSVITGLEVARTVYALTADESAYDNAPIGRGADVALGLGFMALFGASAIYGFYVTGECSKHHHHAVILEQRHQADEQETGDPNDLPSRPPAAHVRPSARPQSETAP